MQLRNIWDSIKEITSNIWNEIKNVVSTLVSLVKETAISGFEALRDGIKNAIRELPKIVSDIFEKIGSTISGWYR